ncbi:MAG: alkaline phosphatase family protein [Bacillota bacterium]
MEERTLMAASIPHFDHVVVAIEENKAYSQIIGSTEAPFINSLARGGALFTRSYAVSHPSQPNYLALFAGSTLGITTDNDPGILTAPNLAQELFQNHMSFAGYTDGIVPKHNPWLDFSNVPKSANQPMSHFPRNFSKLPTVSFVTPNQAHDMHDGTIGQGDTWLASHLGQYAQWAKTHNSLLIVTFDEDDDSHGNHIATVFYGAGVQPGRYKTPITHYRVLRTLEDVYNLPHIGAAATATPITQPWTA